MQEESWRKRPGLCPAYCAECQRQGSKVLCERKIMHPKAQPHDCGKH